MSDNLSSIPETHGQEAGGKDCNPNTAGERHSLIWNNAQKERPCPKNKMLTQN